VFVGHANDLPKGFQVSVVIDASLWFESLPSTVKSDGVHAPVLEVEEIMISQGVVGVESGEVWMERVYFVDGVHTMIDSIATVLIHEERVRRIYAERVDKSH
jgi:hypothetical protein